MASAWAKKTMAAALEAGAERDYQKALELLASLMASNEELPEAILYFGRACHALGDFGRAIIAFRTYLDAGPEGIDESAGLFFLGRSYAQIGRYVSAIQCLRRSTLLNPDRPMSWALLGASFLKLKRTKFAVTYLEEALKRSPQDKRIYRGYLNALFARSIRLISTAGAADNNELGRQMLAFIIQNSEGTALLHLWLAKALRNLGRLEEALGEAHRALALDPASANIRWVLASFLLAAGKHQEALIEFENLKAGNPALSSGEITATENLEGAEGLKLDDQSLMMLRIMVLFRNGNYRPALSACLGLLHQDGRNVALRAVTAECLRELGEYERARNHYQRAIDLSPNNAELRLGQALILYDLGEYATALVAIERAQKMGSREGECRLYRALCQSKLGIEPQALLPELQTLVHTQNETGGRPEPRLYFAMGETLYRLGRPELARSWIERVLDLNPKHEESLLYRLAIHESLGEDKKRETAYGHYLQLYPDNGSIRREFVAWLISRSSWLAAAQQLEEGFMWSRPSAGSRQLLANCYRNARRYREAALIYRDLLKTSPTSSRNIVGLAHALSGCKQLDQAIAIIEMAPKVALQNPGPWIMLGSLYLKIAKNDPAFEAFQKAVSLSRKATAASKSLRTVASLHVSWANLAAICEKQGYAEMAKRCRQMATKNGELMVENNFATDKETQGLPPRKTSGEIAEELQTKESDIQKAQEQKKGRPRHPRGQNETATSTQVELKRVEEAEASVFTLPQPLPFNPGRGAEVTFIATPSRPASAVGKKRGPKIASRVGRVQRNDEPRVRARQGKPGNSSEARARLKATSRKANSTKS